MSAPHRPTARIDEALALLAKVWRAHPDWRLGQLIINAIAPSEACPPVYCIEDTALVQRLREMLDVVERLGELEK